MSNVNDIHIRLYRRVATARLEDAVFLYDVNRHNAALYLAGYVVECSLKCLLLSATATKKRSEIVQSFRGAWAHDYEELIARYRTQGGPAFPRDIHKAFSAVKEWSTALRYSPKAVHPRTTRQFLDATRLIYSWMEARL